MADDPENSLEGNESVEDNSTIVDEADDDNEDEELAEDAHETSTTVAQKKSSRRKGNKKKKKKSKTENVKAGGEKVVNPADIPDPYTASCDLVCEAIGMTNVEVDYELPEFQGITNLKSFSIAVRPYILYRNPGTIVAKMYPMIQAKYKEFQDHMASKGQPIQKQTRHHPIAISMGPLDQSGPLTTRKSARTKRSDGDGRKGNDSDQEFEALIKQHEKEQDKLEEEKEKQRHARAVAKTDKRKFELENARAIKRARREKGIPDEENHEYCEVCRQGGELVLCDTCVRAYHVVCIDENMEQAPEGLWSCPHCEEHGPEIKIKEEEKPPAKANSNHCRICGEGEYLVLCANCPSSYHAYCLNPPLEELTPPGTAWYCPRCLVPERQHRVEKILSWRWIEIKYPPPLELKDGEIQSSSDLFLKPRRAMPPRREREFFVKWKNLAFWQCEWLSETEMDVNFSALLRMYWRKFDSEHPPMFDESTLARHHKDDDPYKLRERFYQYGVKPEWMQVHRILNHVSYGKTQQDYLVKWKELPYDQSTWERDDTDISSYEDAIVKYWNHRERMLNEEIPKNVVKIITTQRENKGLPLKDDDTLRKKKKEKIDVRKKYEVQPDYITETGGNLHPYQLEGINWLRHCWSTGTDAILADEMGLGKTVQSLSFLYTLMKEGHSKGPFLIAAPLSTIINWEREAEQWCPDFYVVTYVGDQNSRAVIRENEFSFFDGAVRGGPKVSKLRTQENLKFHVLLTSYECINMDKAILSSIDWAALVVDEAHRLKNNQSTFFKNLREYKINYRVLLTGTPLQNNLEELFHLLNFLAPDRFNQLETFTAEFSEISKEDQIEKLHNLLGPHMLRRLKADVLTGMPSKSELIVRVELSPMQKKYYKNILTRNFEALNVKSGGTQMSLINILMELKKCCNHPYLFAKASLEAPKLPNGMYEGTALMKAAGKFMLLQKMMRKLKEGGHRVLIFSQMTMMLDILEDFCDIEGYKFERIDGGVTGQMRQNAIDRFNAPGAQQFVFLLSTRAGGLGINLATADTVIIYDSDWNPHNDIQAFSRAHRLGQKHKVMIYRFVTKNSVEERITSVAKKKMLLTHLVVRAGLGAKDGKSMSKSELDDVLRWGTEELFKDEEQAPETGDGEGTSDSSNVKKAEQEIVWDDAAVDFLLNRDKEEEGQEGEKKDWTNEYLSSFKVATYNTKEAGEEIDEQEDETEIINQGSAEADPNYWEKLLKHHYDQDQEIEQEQLGKGKRQRKQINYANEKMVQNVITQSLPHQEEDDGSEYGSDNEEPLHSDDDFEETRRRNRRENTEILPPLHAKVNGQTEVLGFTTRQRKSYLNAIMRWGIPPANLNQPTIWQVRDLRGKSEKLLRAYTSLFMRHLCEPCIGNPETFSDGIPREGLQRHAVLGRIGLLHMIRQKVDEFEAFNGDWSIPDSREQAQAATVRLLQQQPPLLQQQTPIEGMPTVEEIKTEIEPPKEEKRHFPPFKFNICDGGFTELHTLWEKEARLARNGKEYEIWNRRHDYWLLAAACFYGYGRYQVNFQDIANDLKFSILNEPFKAQTAAEVAAYGDAKYKFIQTRFKLLEQALMIEEQLKRAAHMNKQENPDPIGNLASTFAELENTADANLKVAKESRNGDRNASVVFRNVLGKLDQALDNMKSDIIKMPTTASQIGSVTDRLRMNERTILSRLIPGQALRRPALPPSGPFIVPYTNQRFDNIQPMFNSLLQRNRLQMQQMQQGPSILNQNIGTFGLQRGFITNREELPNIPDPNIPSTSSAGYPPTFDPRRQL